MTTRSRYAAAKHDLFAGLTDVLQQMVDDEEAGKPDNDVVLLVGQRMQVMLVRIERVLKGLN